MNYSSKYSKFCEFCEDKNKVSPQFGELISRILFFNSDKSTLDSLVRVVIILDFFFEISIFIAGCDYKSLVVIFWYFGAFFKGKNLRLEGFLPTLPFFGYPVNSIRTATNQSWHGKDSSLNSLAHSKCSARSSRIWVVPRISSYHQLSSWWNLISCTIFRSDRFVSGHLRGTFAFCIYNSLELFKPMII